MAEKIHVLLVDDEPDFLETMAFRLHSEGYYVSIASNGQRAIQIVKEEPPHIVFLDINLPEMDGIEILRNIRGFNPTVPVIMLTAFPEIGEFFVSDEKTPQLKELGVSGFLFKDAGFDELLDKIETTLKAKESRTNNSK